MGFIAGRGHTLAPWLLFGGAGNFTRLTDRVGAAPLI
jgi:hypothetical protein